jgi:hypothetical protein
MSRYRIICGLIWAVIALGIGAGGVAELTIANIGGAVVSFIIAVPAAWYDYRIWTRKGPPAPAHPLRTCTEKDRDAIIAGLRIALDIAERAASLIRGRTAGTEPA